MKKYVLFFIIVTGILIALDVFKDEIDFSFFISKTIVGIIATTIFYLFEKKSIKKNNGPIGNYSFYLEIAWFILYLSKC